MRCLLLCVLVPTLVAQEAPPTFEARLEAAEAVMTRFYRGESVEQVRERMNAQVETFNAQLKARQAELDAAQEGATRDRRVAQDKIALVEHANRSLEVAEISRLAAEATAASEKARKTIAAYNALLASNTAETDVARSRLKADQALLRARLDVYDAFREKGEDLRFFQGVNRLLADLRREMRAGREALAPTLEKVRSLRRELARWAQDKHARQENGLVLVEAMVEDEPCWFMVDTGAQLVCLSLELIEAAGLTGRLGEERTLTLAGGQRIRGRGLDLLSLSVVGETQPKVAASAVPVSDVGIDGLLGQSFLKRFVYTIDERRQPSLILVRR